MEECAASWSLPEGIAGIPVKEGISVRFEKWMNDNKALAGVDFLRRAYEYALIELAADADELIYEWADGITGECVVADSGASHNIFRFQPAIEQYPPEE